jgi:hypothetical protein
MSTVNLNIWRKGKRYSIAGERWKNIVFGPHVSLNTETINVVLMFYLGRLEKVNRIQHIFLFLC